MCNFSDVVEQRGIEKGLERGLEQGRREAEQEMARRMAENGLSVELICRCTSFSESEVKELVK